MPKYVNFKDVGLVEFPDDYTDDQIASTLAENEQTIQQGVIERKRRDFEAETLAAPENAPTPFERVAAGFGSLTRGAGETAARAVRVPQHLYEAAEEVAPRLTDLVTPPTWRSKPSPYRVSESIEGVLPTVDPTTETGIQGALVNPVARGLGQVAGMAPAGPAAAVALGTGAEFDDAYERELQRQKDAGEPVSKAKAAGKAALYGTLVGFVENKLGIGRILRKYGTGAASRGKELAKKTAADIAAGYSEEFIEKMGQDYIVDGEFDWKSINQEGLIGGIVQGIAGAPANIGNRRIGSLPGTAGPESRQSAPPPPETEVPPGGTEPPPSGTEEPTPETNVPPGETPPPGGEQTEANQILKVLTAPEQEPNAVQEPTATEGVLREGEPSVGLPRVEPEVRPRPEEGAPPEAAAPGTPVEPTPVQPQVTPQPDWRITVQAPEGEVPGFVQVTDPKAGEDSGKVTLPEGSPDFSKLPTGVYTYAEAVAKLGESQPTPEKAPQASQTAKPKPEYPPDIFDDLTGITSTISQKSWAEAVQSASQDRFTRRALKSNRMRRLVSREGGESLDRVLDALHREGKYLEVENAEQLRLVIERAETARVARAKGQVSGAKGEDAELAALEALGSGERKKGKPKAGDPITASDLNQGDKFTISGEPVEVLRVDENGFVTLRGGKVIGSNMIVPGNMIIRPDEGSYQSGEQEITDTEPFDRRPNQKRPFSRPIWTMTDEELADIVGSPARGTVGADVEAKTYRFRDYAEFKAWMEGRYAARDLAGMALGYASVDAPMKLQFIKENRKSPDHLKAWISHLATGSPIPTEDPPVTVTERPDPASMGGGTARGRGPTPPQRPARPAQPPRPPSPRSPFTTEALVQLLRAYGNFPRINRLLRAARGRFTQTGVELKQRLFWDPAQAMQTLAHEIGHFVDLALSPEGRGRQFARRWQPLADFRRQVGQSKALRAEAKSLSRAWRGGFPDGDSYRDTASELFADVMSAILTKPDLVNQQWPLLHDTFQGLLDGKPDFKRAYDDLTRFLQSDSVGGLGTGQRREAYKASIEQFAQQEGPERIGFWRGVKRALVSVWEHAHTIEGKPEAIGDRMIDRLEDNQLMAVRAATILDSQFKKRVQPHIDGIDGGGERGHFTLSEFLEAGRVINERTASGQWIEENADEAHSLMEAILEETPTLAAKYGSELDNATTGQEHYDLMAKILREVHDLGDRQIRRVQNVIDRFDDELDGAAMLQAFNVRGKLLNPSGLTVEAAKKLQSDIMARLSTEELAHLLAAREAFFDLTSQVMTQAHDMGLISDRTWKNLIEPNLRNFVPFAVLDYFDGKVGAGIYKQMGTAKNIVDPILSTQLKMASMFNWMQRQLTTQMLMETYARGGYTIQVGRRLKGAGDLQRERSKHAHDAISRLQLWRDGQAHLVELPDDPGKSFETASERPSFLQDLHLWQNSAVGKYSRGILSLYTTLSPSFQIFSNPLRDFHTSAQRMGYLPALKRTGTGLFHAIRLARNYSRAAFGGSMLPEVEALVANGSLPPPQLSRAFYNDPDLLEQMILNGGLTAMQISAGRPQSAEPPGRLKAAYQKAERFAAMLEALPKIQTYYGALESGLTPEESAALARRAGIPNPAIGGRWSGFVEAFMPWTRVHIQGLRSTFDVARDPKLGKKFLGRVAVFEGVPRVARYLIASGIVAAALGRDDDDESWLATLGEFFRRASPYKMAMDNLIPIGWRDSRTGEMMPLVSTFGMKASEIPDHWEAVSYRMPSSEEGKMWGSLLWGILSGMDKDVSRAGRGPLENAGDWVLNTALPGTNPMFGIVQRQNDLWIRGRNPTDPFRGTPVANEEMFKAGGLDRAQANFGALLNEMGDAGKIVGMIATGLGMNPDALDWSRKGSEKPATLAQLPVTSRMLSFDNYARYRQEQLDEQEKAKYGARARLLLPEGARDLYSYYTKNVGRQKYLDETERQKFQTAKNWHSDVWGNREHTEKMFSRALQAVSPDGSNEAKETVKRDLETLSKPYVDLFQATK